MTERDRKDGAAVRFPPPLLPVATILGGIALSRYVPLLNLYELPTPARYWIGGAIVAASLLGLGLWSVVKFRRSGQNELPWTPTPEIIVEGPYRYTRNPMYLQMVLICIGFSIILASLWILVLTPVCALLLYLFAIKPEEAYLELKFGESYLQYKRSVRRWI